VNNAPIYKSFVLLARYSIGYQTSGMSRRREMGRRVGEQKCLQSFDGETRDCFENLEAGGRMTTLTVRKYEAME
jgi:hypothetical protein